MTVKLLAAESFPKVLEQTMTLKDSDVAPHPRYKYFNEASTVVVLNKEDGSVRIGNALDTNLSGKVILLESNDSDMPDVVAIQMLCINCIY
jgi:hypothetical protein